jgi:hypothetical protein
MYGLHSGTPDASAWFGSGDYYQPAGGYGGPSWPGWHSGEPHRTTTPR